MRSRMHSMRGAWLRQSVANQCGPSHHVTDGVCVLPERFQALRGLLRQLVLRLRSHQLRLLLLLVRRGCVLWGRVATSWRSSC